MVANWGDLKERVARDLEPYLGRLNGDEIEEALTEAIEHYASEPFSFLDVISAGLTTTALQDSNTLPTDLVSLDLVTLTIGGRAYLLDDMPFDRYRQLQQSAASTTGQPSDYSLFADSIWWYATPVEAFPYTLYYRGRLAAPSEDEETNGWVDSAWPLLRYYALDELGSTALHGNVPGPLLDRWQMKASEKRSELRSKGIGRELMPRHRARDF